MSRFPNATLIWRTRRPCRAGGFTLPELVVVIVLSAIVAATAAPALASLGGARAKAAGRQLLRDLTYARQRAMATGTTSWVVFDTGDHSWSVLSEDPDDPGRADASVLTDMATGRDFVTTLNTGSYVGVTMSDVDFDSDVEIAFDWLGRPWITDADELAAQGSVEFNNGSTVYVEAVTGHIRFVP